VKFSCDHRKRRTRDGLFVELLELSVLRGIDATALQLASLVPGLAH
jgi:hypothetical protein